MTAADHSTYSLSQLSLEEASTNKALVMEEGSDPAVVLLVRKSECNPEELPSKEKGKVRSGRARGRKKGVTISLDEFAEGGVTGLIDQKKAEIRMTQLQSRAQWNTVPPPPPPPRRPAEGGPSSLEGSLQYNPPEWAGSQVGFSNSGEESSLVNDSSNSGGGEDFTLSELGLTEFTPEDWSSGGGGPFQSRLNPTSASFYPPGAIDLTAAGEEQQSDFEGGCGGNGAAEGSGHYGEGFQQLVAYGHATGNGHYQPHLGNRGAEVVDVSATSLPDVLFGDPQESHDDSMASRYHQTVIIGCNSTLLEQYYQLKSFKLKSSYLADAASICQPYPTAMLLLNLTTRMLHGVFEAIGPEVGSGEETYVEFQEVCSGVSLSPSAYGDLLRGVDGLPASPPLILDRYTTKVLLHMLGSLASAEQQLPQPEPSSTKPPPSGPGQAGVQYPPDPAMAAQRATSAGPASGHFSMDPQQAQSAPPSGYRPPLPATAHRHSKLGYCPPQYRPFQVYAPPPGVPRMPQMGMAHSMPPPYGAPPMPFPPMPFMMPGPMAAMPPPPPGGWRPLSPASAAPEHAPPPTDPKSTALPPAPLLPPEGLSTATVYRVPLVVEMEMQQQKWQQQQNGSKPIPLQQDQASSKGAPVSAAPPSSEQPMDNVQGSGPPQTGKQCPGRAGSKDGGLPEHRKGYCRICRVNKSAYALPSCSHYGPCIQCVPSVESRKYPSCLQCGQPTGDMIRIY